MTIHINHIDNGVGIEIVASGIVTGEEIIEAHKEIYNETNLKNQKYQIIDRSHCKEYKVSSADVQQIAEIDKAASKSNPDIIIALISPTDIQFGMSRMWQTYVEESRFLSKVFRDSKSADEWIKKQLMKT
jgi:hypothetical protein